MTKYKTRYCEHNNDSKTGMAWTLGHVVRMNETRSVKKIFERKLEG